MGVKPELKAKKPRRANGDGSVYQDKQGRWIASLDAGIGINGKRKRATRVRKTRQEASQALRQMQVKKQDNRLKSNERQTLNDLFQQWQTYGIPEGIRETTKQEYLYLSKRYVLPALGHKRVIDITTQVVDSWLVGMHQMGYSAITRRKARQNMNMIFKFGVKRRFIIVNPVSDSMMPKNDANYVTQVRESLSLEEWLKYLSGFKETNLDTFVHIGALLGLRRGEIIGLNWSDIDFKSNHLFVRHSARELTKHRQDGSTETTLVLNDPKTKHSKRKLVLSPEIIDSLNRQKLRQKKARLAAGSAWNDQEDAIFTTSVGTRLYPSNVYKQYGKLIKVLGLRYVRIHDLRHSVARLLLDDEVPLESVSRLLGHSSLSITMDIYAQNVQSVVDRGARGMSALYQKNQLPLVLKRRHARQ